MMKKIENFLTTHFDIIPVNQTIANLAIQSHQKYKLKVPAAIIFSTAQFINGLLVTREDKDFPVSDPMVRIPYQI